LNAVENPPLSLLSRLWLAEPDEKTLSLAREVGLACDDDPATLAAAWTDIFLLNVYPYGTAFTDLSGELNGPAAAATLARFEAAGYDPPELASAGAPDHAGLCLGFLAHVEGSGGEDPEFLAGMFGWIPVCALAVERQPLAHPLYKSLAAATSEALLRRASVSAASSTPGFEISAPPAEEEVGLSVVVRRLLAPAASGFFLSRSRLGEIALAAGMRLPFGSRHEVARALFEAAGESGRVEAILSGLRSEAAAWGAAYAGLSKAHPAWKSHARDWRLRLAATGELLSEMGRLLDTPLEVEYGNGGEFGSGGP
jgi:nitrate reductase delta subunit